MRRRCRGSALHPLGAWDLDRTRLLGVWVIDRLEFGMYIYSCVSLLHLLLCQKPAHGSTVYASLSYSSLLCPGRSTDAEQSDLPTIIASTRLLGVLLGVIDRTSPDYARSEAIRWAKAIQGVLNIGAEAMFDKESAFYVPYEESGIPGTKDLRMTQTGLAVKCMR